MSALGVVIAAAMTMIRIAYLNFRSRKPAVTTPNRARKNTSTASGTTSPRPRITFT